ncbi:hypothetical protein R1flu_013778 [Riccia fluitans]|uniref:RRM domain-containing protein n=1 Tax=Riccia fluitans TaxID=41844 RepID=A0ABD1YHX7_9MARC
MAAASVTVSSVVQASSPLCSGIETRSSGQDATTSAVRFSAKTAYTSSSVVPSVFQSRKSFGCSKFHARSARNVVRAAAASSAGSEEEIRQFCLKQFGARKALKIAGAGLTLHQRSSQHVAPASRKKRSPVLDFDEDDEDEDEDDSDNEDDEFLNMEEWMKKKPVGFGAGKVYDTTLEERLLEEIKRDELAQAAAKAASKKKKPTSAVKQAKKPVDDVPPEGVEVFVKNLPKKRNVDRDLRAALRSVSGLIHVRPVVSGNDKTREPVCKGLAYLTFTTVDDAEDFVDRYNSESILFGKVEKRIACELAKTNSSQKVNSSEPSSGHRLAVRDSLSEDESLITVSTVSLSVENATAVETPSYVDKSSANISSLNVEVVENVLPENESMEEDEADLFELEQQIWDELENEEDFDLDLEIEAELEEEEEEEEEDGRETASFSEEGDDSTLSTQQEDENEFRPEVSGQGFGKSTPSVKRGDHSRNSMKKPVGSVDEKEKRIKELEAKLEELQSQLNKRNAMEFSRAKEGGVSVASKEQKIEALEQRLLRRAKAGKETNVSNGKPSSSTEKSGAKKSQRNSSSPLEKASRDKKPKPPQRLKLGASSRLKNREREIFTEALSKYSAPPRDKI